MSVPGVSVAAHRCAKVRVSAAAHSVKYLALGAGLVLLLASPLSADRASRRQPSLIQAGWFENPYSYLYGSVVSKGVIRGGKGQDATNVTFQPRYASDLATESVLFCGNRLDMFEDAGPIVVTYERVAHKAVENVACFDLVSVDHVNSPRPESR